MKKAIYVLGFWLVVALHACTDFVDPAIPYTGFNTAVFLRTISTTPEVSFYQLNTAQFELVVEAVDATNGGSVEQVEVFVRRRRLATLSNEVLLTTVPKSAFGPNSESKYQRATINFSFLDAITAMGFTTADIEGGDFFEFRLAATDNQGRVFTNTNLSGDVSGGEFYRSPFFYRVAVVCPLDQALFVGSYLYEPLVDGPYGPTYGNSKLVTLELVTGSNTRRRIVGLIYLEHLGIGNGAQNIDLDLVCGDVVFPTYGANLSCGSGNIGMGPAQGANIMTYDPVDDSELLVGLTEFVTDGGCGESPTQVSFRLTKQ